MPLRVPLQRFDERLRRLRPLLLRARRGLWRGRQRRGWLPRRRLLDRGEQVPKRLRRQNRVIQQPNSQPLLRSKQQLRARQRVQPSLALDQAVRRQHARFPLGMKLPRQFERELEKRRFSTCGRRGMRSQVHGWGRSYTLLQNRRLGQDRAHVALARRTPVILTAASANRRSYLFAWADTYPCTALSTASSARKVDGAKCGSRNNSTILALEFTLKFNVLTKATSSLNRRFTYSPASAYAAGSFRCQPLVARRTRLKMPTWQSTARGSRTVCESFSLRIAETYPWARSAGIEKP